MTTSEVLREARNVLFERGWSRGSLEKEDGSVCLLGAAAVAICGHSRLASESEIRSFDAVYDVLRQVVGTHPGMWNDMSSRTFGDVVDTLDRAEKIAEQREATA